MINHDAALVVVDLSGGRLSVDEVARKDGDGCGGGCGGCGWVVVVRDGDEGGDGVGCTGGVMAVVDGNDGDGGSAIGGRRGWAADGG
ncbi:hypothetical protein Tco_0327298 [Tanacetum coccineum]